MNYRLFVDSIESGSMPDGLNPHLQALWHDAAGDWNTAHEIVQELNDVTAARIHAYLHRVEGDNWNARYWHGRAGSVFPEELSPGEEWEMLVRALIDS